MRPKGSFWKWYTMMGIIKALKCCQKLYQVVVCPCSGTLFKWWTWVDLDHFYDRVKFVPDASVWVTDYTTLRALVFPSVFLFSISSALRWEIQDQWSSDIRFGCKLYKQIVYFWPFESDTSVVVYSNCQCSPAFCLSLIYCSIYFG